MITKRWNQLKINQKNAQTSIRYTNSCSLLFNLLLFMPALTKVVWCPYHQSRKVFFVESRNLRLRVFAIATCGSNQLYCAHFEVSPVPVRVFLCRSTLQVQQASRSRSFVRVKKAVQKIIAISLVCVLATIYTIIQTTPSHKENDQCQEMQMSPSQEQLARTEFHG